MLDLTLAIVTYNNEGTIRNCIESLIRHLDGRFAYQLYVIDNCSKDRTIDIIESISGSIKIIRNSRNAGFGTAHNQIIELLGSRYHLVVNPDIEITNECIAEMANFMDKREDIGLLSPLIKHPDGRIQYLCKHNPTFFDLFVRLAFPNFFKKRQNRFEMRYTGYDKEFMIEYATGCFMFFRTEIFKKLQGFDEHFFLYLEDADITRRVNEISKTVFFPNNYVIHGWQRGSHKKLNLALIDIKSAFYYFGKWGFKLY